MSLTVRFHLPVIKKAETFYFGETKGEFREVLDMAKVFLIALSPPPPTVFKTNIDRMEMFEFSPDNMTLGKACFITVTPVQHDFEKLLNRSR